FTEWEESNAFPANGSTMAAPTRTGTPVPRRTTAFRMRSTDASMAGTQASADSLKRSLGRTDLIAMGVGTIIGAGIFVTTGVAAVKSLFGVTARKAISVGPRDGGIVNLPAMIIVGVIVAVLVLEVKIAAAVVMALVALTVGVLVLVIALGAPHLHAGNWAPFM